MTELQKKSPPPGRNRAEGDTKTKHRHNTAAEARRQGRITGKLVVGGCTVAESAARTDRTTVPKHELLRRVRAKEIDRLMEHRHGDIINDARGTDDYEAVCGYVMAIGGSRGNVDGWTSRWTPWFDDAAVLQKARALATRMEGNKRGPAIMTADAVAKLMNVRFEERQLLKLTTVGAADVPAVVRKHRIYEEKRVMERERAAAKRKASGATPRAESTEAQKPWVIAGVSRATWYRRNRETDSLLPEETTSLHNRAGNETVSPHEEGADRADTAPASIFVNSADAKGPSTVAVETKKPTRRSRSSGSGGKPPAGGAGGLGTPVARNAIVLDARDFQVTAYELVRNRLLAGLAQTRGGDFAQSH